MADAATITVSATMLPDEIATTLSGSMTVTPDDANDKWYYKLTICKSLSGVFKVIISFNFPSAKGDS